MEYDQRTLRDHRMICTLGEAIEEYLAGAGAIHPKYVLYGTPVVENENLEASLDDVERLAFFHMLVGPYIATPGEDDDHFVEFVLDVRMSTQPDALPLILDGHGLEKFYIPFGDSGYRLGCVENLFVEYGVFHGRLTP